MGASTCALGSHKCTPYRGIFTKKANRQPADHSIFEWSRGHSVKVNRDERIERVPELYWIKSVTRRGREPARV